MTPEQLKLFPKEIKGKKVVKWIALKPDDNIMKFDCYFEFQDKTVETFYSTTRSKASYFFPNDFDEFLLHRPVFKQRIG